MAGTLAATLGSALQAGNVTQVNYANDIDLHFRIRNGLAGTPAWWHYSGTVFGKLSGEKTVPLTGIEGVSRTKIARADDGSWSCQTAEAGYFVDRATREPLELWTNPLTGMVNRVEHYFSEELLQVDALGNISPPELPDLDNLDYTGAISTLERRAERAWSHEDIAGRLKLNGKPLTFSRLKTYSADAVQLDDAACDFVEAQLNYHTLGAWRDWMGMTEAQGVMSFRLTSQKFRSADDISPALIDRIKHDHPNFLGK